MIMRRLATLAYRCCYYHLFNIIYLITTLFLLKFKQTFLLKVHNHTTITKLILEIFFLIDMKLSPLVNFEAKLKMIYSFLFKYSYEDL